jgi:hypothetical protein
MPIIIVLPFLIKSTLRKEIKVSFVQNESFYVIIEGDRVMMIFFFRLQVAYNVYLITNANVYVFLLQVAYDIH